MASSSSQITILLFILIAFSSFKSSKSCESSESCGIAVYWGQHSDADEGTLREACDTGLYKYINLAYLINIGSGQKPLLNLAGHCSDTACRGLSEEIHFCQNLGIKVQLSLGAISANLSSPQDAKNVADYLWTTFLAPDSEGPLGNASLDGIDFAIWGAESPFYWDDLARELAKYRSQKNISLAALPECPYADHYLNAAIQTGLFNYVWVQFYDNPECDYSRGAANLIIAWNRWSASLPPNNTQLLLGLPASPDAASSGYIPPDNLRTDILPVIKDSKNYGGLMLWDRYYDRRSGYSSRVHDAVCVTKPPSESCGIAVYWGQHSDADEGTLHEACDTGLYKYINLAYLINIGSGQKPLLNLAGHCSDTACRGLSEEIHFCQNLGIKVQLSLGAISANLSSPQDAKNVADYLWTTFLAPDSEGPLGNASLDGIDFAIWGAESPFYWDDLARELAKYRSQKNISLAALPECPYADHYLNAAIQTGLFNYVWVQFYDNPECDYSRGAANLIIAWNRWSASLPPNNTQLLLGLPASPDAASSGYIPPDNLRTDILPVIKDSKNYGGLMLWDRYYDRRSGYSSLVHDAVCDTILKLPSDRLRSNW